MQKMIRRLTTLSVGLSTALGAVLGLTAPASAAPHVSLKLTITSSAQPIAGDVVTFTGATSKAYSGARLYLQAKNKQHHWLTLKKPKVRKDGSFSVRARALGLGRTPYRVMMVDRAHPAWIVSNTVHATIFNYFYLSDLSKVGDDGFGDGWGPDPIAIAGRNYSHSISENLWSDEKFSFNLSYKCRSFDGTLGFLDSARSGTTGAVTMSMDGAQLGLTNINVGAGQFVSYNTDKGFRLDFEFQNFGGAAFAGIGDGRLLCSGHP